MTVLELLELQARARAIRSQLAMEPVTKIELDSDTDDQGTSSRNSRAGTRRESRSSREPDASKSDDQLKKKKRKDQERNQSSLTTDASKAKSKTLSQDLEKTKQPQKSLEKPTNQPAPTKRIKLKRNFRAPSSLDIEVTNENNENIDKQDLQPVQGDNDKVNETPTEVKQEKENNHESSPDVIAMHPSPETVLLSSDSDNEESANTSKKSKPSKKKSVQKPITDTKPVEIKEPPRKSNNTPVDLSFETEELDYEDQVSDTEQPTKQVEKEPQPDMEEVNKENEKEDTKSDEVNKIENHAEQSDISLSSESGGDDWEDTIYDETGVIEDDRPRNGPEDLREKLRRKRQEAETAKFQEQKKNTKRDSSIEKEDRRERQSSSSPEISFVKGDAQSNHSEESEQGDEPVD